MHLLERRRSFRCTSCGTIKHIDAPQSADGITVVDHPADAQRCPGCAARMASALLDGHHAVMHCDACRGVLLPRQCFALVVHERRAWASGAAEEPSPSESGAAERNSFCPGCSARMATYPYFGPGSLIFDTCDACDLVWLELGELNKIADAPGAARGGRRAPRRG